MPVTTNVANPPQRNEQRKATGQQGQLNGRKTPVSWAEKVKVTNANSRFSLEPLARPPPGEQLVLPEEAMEDLEQWSRCLVGFFPGYKFPYHAINSMAMRVWKSKGITTVKDNQGSKEGNDMPVIQHEEGADKRMPEHTTKGRNDMQLNPKHNHPLNQTNQITGSSHVPKPHHPMQNTNPKVKTVAHPAEAHKNSHPTHLNNNPDPEIAEPTDCTDTTASSAKEKDTALIRAKGKGPLHAENNSNTILGIGISNEDTGESASSASAGPTEDNAEDLSSPAPKTARKKKGGKSRKVGNHQ
ncbi:hypothetical protein OIU79_007956 [Salix purpurea]|uniref:Uncharacterized protein n=1 Tax=Salix purpurea TaxID=77065 RepID=A0A9Q0THJ0_SALPP|nr:hypothetical protein OIU79_007956 [Salix purpurea]